MSKIVLTSTSPTSVQKMITGSFCTLQEAPCLPDLTEPRILTVPSSWFSMLRQGSACLFSSIPLLCRVLHDTEVASNWGVADDMSHAWRCNETPVSLVNVRLKSHNLYLNMQRLSEIDPSVGPSFFRPYKFLPSQRTYPSSNRATCTILAFGWYCIRQCVVRCSVLEDRCNGVLVRVDGFVFSVQKL